MTHSLHGSDNHGDHNGFTALGKKIGTPKSTETDTDYVSEHPKSTETDTDYVSEHWVLKYLRNKITHYLHDYRRHWFARFGLPPPNGEHDQLRGSQIRRLMRRVQQRIGHDGGRGRERPEIQVFSRLDIGHKDRQAEHCP
jgi:hypothetical protein